MKKWGALVALSMSMFIIVIDTTIMNVSITALADDLNTSVDGIQAAISLYALTMAALMLTAGKLSDIIGRKKTFAMGLAFYGLGTLITALSPSLLILIIGWSIIEGIGGALMMPTMQNILRDTYKGKDRAFGYGLIGGVAASGAALGPLIGGLLTTYASWRWAFVLEFVVVVIVFSLLGFLKKDKLAAIRPKFDFGGAFIGAAGMIFIVLGVLTVSKYGLWTAKEPLIIGDLTIAPFGLSISPFLMGIGTLFILYLFNHLNRRKENKKDILFDPAILGIKDFRNSVAARFTMYFTQAGALYVVPLFMQVYLGLNAFKTGLGLMPLSLGIVFASLGGTRLTAKVLPKKLISYGFLIVLIGFLLLAAMTNAEMTVFTLFPGTLIVGIGFGLVASQIVNLLLSTVKEEKVAEATGVNSTFEQLGNSIGVALVGTILIVGMNSIFLNGVDSSDVFTTESKNEITAFVHEGVENQTDEEKESISDSLNSEELSEISGIVEDSQVKAFAGAIVFLAFITGISLIISFKLPRKKLV